MKATLLFMTAALYLASTPSSAWAQTPTPKLTCPPSGPAGGGRVSFCRMVEFSAPFIGSLGVSTGNGSESIQGWDSADVLIRAEIQTAALNVAEAEALALQVSVDDVEGQVRATGPKSNRLQTWSVSYEIYLPRQADLTATAGNGAISIEDVQGHIRATTGNGSLSLARVGGEVNAVSGNGAISIQDSQGHLRFSSGNGSVSLVRLAGDVEGAAGNGSLAITLGGDHWDGQKLDVRTGMGVIEMNVPHDYSAHIEASTTFGAITTNFPATVEKTHGFGENVSFDDGAGGALIRATTAFGSIRIQHLD